MKSINNINIETDYDLWLEQQAELLRSQDFANLDLDNLIEELEALGRAEKSAVKSSIYQIMLHLLLIDYWTEQKQTRGHWLAKIDAFQLQLEDKLTTNLKQLIEENQERLYQKARKSAARKSDIDINRFPLQCPYSWKDYLDS